MTARRRERRYRRAAGAWVIDGSALPAPRADAAGTHCRHAAGPRASRGRDHTRGSRKPARHRTTAAASNESVGLWRSGTAATRTQAQEVVAQKTPGLVLADIQLADGSSGLDAVDDILAIDSVPVIFITAYPERLLTGDRPEPTYLVTKPFQEQTVRAAISQALFFGSSRPLG